MAAQPQQEHQEHQETPDKFANFRSTIRSTYVGMPSIAQVLELYEASMGRLSDIQSAYVEDCRETATHDGKHTIKLNNYYAGVPGVGHPWSIQSELAAFQNDYQDDEFRAEYAPLKRALQSSEPIALAEAQLNLFTSQSDHNNRALIVMLRMLPNRALTLTHLEKLMKTYPVSPSDGSVANSNALEIARHYQILLFHTLLEEAMVEIAMIASDSNGNMAEVEAHLAYVRAKALPLIGVTSEETQECQLRNPVLGEMLKKLDTLDIQSFEHQASLWKKGILDSNTQKADKRQFKFTQWYETHTILPMMLWTWLFKKAHKADHYQADRKEDGEKLKFFLGKLLVSQLATIGQGIWLGNLTGRLGSLFGALDYFLPSPVFYTLFSLPGMLLGAGLGFIHGLAISVITTVVDVTNYLGRSIKAHQKGVEIASLKGWLQAQANLFIQVLCLVPLFFLMLAIALDAALMKSTVDKLLHKVFGLNYDIAASIVPLILLPVTAPLSAFIVGVGLFASIPSIMFSMTDDFITLLRPQFKASGPAKMMRAATGLAALTAFAFGLAGMGIVAPPVGGLIAGAVASAVVSALATAAASAAIVVGVSWLGYNAINLLSHFLLGANQSSQAYEPEEVDDWNAGRVVQSALLETVEDGADHSATNGSLGSDLAASPVGEAMSPDSSTNGSSYAVSLSM